MLALLPLGAACGEVMQVEARAESAVQQPDASESVSAPTGAKPEEPDSRWTKAPDAPLSGRVDALVATVGDTIVVSGGTDWLCPPGARCARPRTPPHADGAAYDLKAGRWRTIADAPAGFSSPSTAVVGHDVYALTLSPCDPGPTCAASRALLRYRSEADQWDTLQAPAELSSHRLVAVPDGVVAYRSSDEGGSTPDYRFLAGEDRWQALPDDPLPAVYDRFVVAYGERLMLFGTPIARGDSQTKLAAVYHPKTDAWETLAESRRQGYQVWRAGSLLYLNPHFGSSGGGIYDPSTNTWRPWPDLPHYDVAGIIADDGATYEYASGWVLDTRSGEWLEVGPRPDVNDVYDEAIAEGPDHGVVVFGGQTWSGGQGQLVNQLWHWTPRGVK